MRYKHISFRLFVIALIPQHCCRVRRWATVESDVPQDGKWDHTAAHDCRFCVQHEEDKWLLESIDKWMYPSDFASVEERGH
jgi:hypothetical protein